MSSRGSTSSERSSGHSTPTLSAPTRPDLRNLVRKSDLARNLVKELVNAKREEDSICQSSLSRRKSNELWEGTEYATQANWAEMDLEQLQVSRALCIGLYYPLCICDTSARPTWRQWSNSQTESDRTITESRSVIHKCKIFEGLSTPRLIGFILK